MNRYEDIINHPRPELKKHRRASVQSRAAQFGAFRALTGHEDAVAETARYTDCRLELSENMIEILNLRLQEIRGMIDSEPAVKITYFVPDVKKTGGEYVIVIGNVVKIDEYERKIILKDKTEIAINMISNISRENIDK